MLAAAIATTCIATAVVPVIDADYPGGNIVVEKIEGDVVFLKPDLRDTRPGLWWFYWNFRVRGAAGRTLHFRFNERNPFGLTGPAVSRDAGRTWSYLGPAAVRPVTGQKAWEFSYTFPTARDDEVRFCFTIPYLQADLERFLARHRGDRHLVISELCQSKKSRRVELLRLGKLDGEPKHRVLLTARHHACESVANYELEGIMEAVLANTPEGRRWREEVQFMIVPFVDKDGVEDGDQGKVRSPRDHNRDYEGPTVHPEVAAIKAQVPAWLKGKPVFALDLHCPYVREENIYIVGGPNQELWQRVQVFSQILEATQRGPVRYHAKNNMPYGTGWNSPKLAETDPGETFSRWAGELPNAIFSATLEFPYAKRQDDVTADSARAFGHDIARAILRFLAEHEN